MRIMPEAFHCIPDRFETQKVCIKVVEADPSNLGNVLDHLKIREMCDAAVREDPSSLIYVLDWFVKPQQVNMWYDDYYNDGTMVIKNVRPRKQKLRMNFCPLLGILIERWLGACQETAKSCGSNK